MNQYFYQEIKFENISDIKIVIDAPYEGILETYLKKELINKRNFNANDEFKLSPLKHTRPGYYFFHLK